MGTAGEETDVAAVDAAEDLTDEEEERVALDINAVVVEPDLRGDVPVASGVVEGGAAGRAALDDAVVRADELTKS